MGNESRLANPGELTDFPTAMANCGLWMEDEHVFDPDEVDEGDLDGS